MSLPKPTRNHKSYTLSDSTLEGLAALSKRLGDLPHSRVIDQAVREMVWRMFGESETADKLKKAGKTKR